MNSPVTQAMREVAQAVATKHDTTGWTRRHMEAWAIPNRGAELAFRNLIRGAAEYADAHARRYESPIGEDGVLGVEWLAIMRALVGLLNGELGRFDGGTLDEMLRAMAKAAGFEVEL